MMKRSTTHSVNPIVLTMAGLVGLLILLMAATPAGASPMKRSAPTAGPTVGPTTGDACPKATPCGWFVYKPFIRTLDYHVHGPCSCPNSTRCVRVDDDISISAFIYRCRSPAEAGDSAEELPGKPGNGTDFTGTNEA